MLAGHLLAAYGAAVSVGELARADGQCPSGRYSACLVEICALCVGVYGPCADVGARGDADCLFVCARRYVELAPVRRAVCRLPG